MYMILENVLTKVHEKLANDEIGLAMQKCDSEMGELALTCLRAKRVKQAQSPDLNSIKDFILSGLSSAGDKINSIPGGKNIAGSIGGAALGGLFGNLSSSKGEFETDDDFKRRKRNSTLSGLVAGGAVGASVPSILNGLGNTAKSIVAGDGDQKETIKDKAKSLLNPNTILGTAGFSGGAFLNNYLTKNNLATLTSKAREEGGKAFQKAIGDHTYGSDTALFKKLEKFMSKRVSGGLGSPIVRKDPMIMKALKGALKRKILLPVAGAAALPALNELYLGDKFFDKPAF